jgi:hypothetical protein
MKNKKVLLIALCATAVVVLIIVAVVQLSHSHRPSEEVVYERCRLDGSGAVCVQLTQGETLSGYLEATKGGEDIQVTFCINDSAGNPLVSPEIVGDKYDFEITAPKQDYYYLYYDSSASGAAGAPTIFLYLTSSSTQPTPKVYELFKIDVTVRVYDIDRKTPLPGIVVRPKTEYQGGFDEPDKVEPTQQLTDASGTASFSYFLQGQISRFYIEAEFGSWLGIADWKPDIYNFGDQTAFIIKPSFDVRVGVDQAEVGPIEPISISGNIKNFGPFEEQYRLYVWLLDGVAPPAVQGVISPGETVRISQMFDPSTYNPEGEGPLGTWPNGIHEANFYLEILEGDREIASTSWNYTWGVPPYP